MANNNKPATTIIETIHLRVHIHCEGCKKKVKKVLNKVEGVYTVDVDASISKVTITGTADAKTLIKKLEKAHKVVELWPTVEAPPGHGFKGREDVFKGKGEGIMKGKEDVLKGKEGVIKGKEEVVIKGKEEVVQQGKVKEVKEEGEAKLLKKQEEPEQKQRQNQNQNQKQNQNQNQKQKPDPAELQAKQEENAAEVSQKKEDDNGAKKAAENGSKRNNNNNNNNNSKRNNANGCQKPNGGVVDTNVHNKSMGMDNGMKGMEKKSTSNGGVGVVESSNLKKAETLVDEPNAKAKAKAKATATAGGVENAKARSDTMAKKGSLPLRPDMADEGKKPEMVVMEEKSGDGDGVFASSSSNTSSPSHMNKHVAPPPMVLVETSPEYFVSEMGSAEEYATHMFSDENANNVCIVM